MYYLPQKPTACLRMSKLYKYLFIYMVSGEYNYVYETTFKVKRSWLRSDGLHCVGWNSFEQNAALRGQEKWNKALAAAADLLMYKSSPPFCLFFSLFDLLRAERRQEFVLKD